jgi:hypothetical protein
MIDGELNGYGGPLLVVIQWLLWHGPISFFGEMHANRRLFPIKFFCKRKIKVPISISGTVGLPTHPSLQLSC